jgi:hypothetical protein
MNTTIESREGEPYPLRVRYDVGFGGLRRYVLGTPFMKRGAGRLALTTVPSTPFIRRGSFFPSRLSSVC